MPHDEPRRDITTIPEDQDRDGRDFGARPTTESSSQLPQSNTDLSSSSEYQRRRTISQSSPHLETSGIIGSSSAATEANQDRPIIPRGDTQTEYEPGTGSLQTPVESPCNFDSDGRTGVPIHHSTGASTDSGSSTDHGQHENRHPIQHGTSSESTTQSGAFQSPGGAQGGNQPLVYSTIEEGGPISHRLSYAHDSKNDRTTNKSSLPRENTPPSTLAPSIHGSATALPETTSSAVDYPQTSSPNHVRRDQHRSSNLRTNAPYSAPQTGQPVHQPQTRETKLETRHSPECYNSTQGVPGPQSIQGMGCRYPQQITTHISADHSTRSPSHSEFHTASQGTTEAMARGTAATSGQPAQVTYTQVPQNHGYALGAQTVVPNSPASMGYSDPSHYQNVYRSSGPQLALSTGNAYYGHSPSTGGNTDLSSGGYYSNDGRYILFQDTSYTNNPSSRQIYPQLPSHDTTHVYQPVEVTYFGGQSPADQQVTHQDESGDGGSASSGRSSKRKHPSSAEYPSPRRPPSNRISGSVERHDHQHLSWHIIENCFVHYPGQTLLLHSRGELVANTWTIPKILTYFNKPNMFLDSLCQQALVKAWVYRPRTPVHLDPNSFYYHVTGNTQDEKTECAVDYFIRYPDNLEIFENITSKSFCLQIHVYPQLIQLPRRKGSRIPLLEQRFRRAINDPPKPLSLRAFCTHENKTDILQANYVDPFKTLVRLLSTVLEEQIEPDEVFEPELDLYCNDKVTDNQDIIPDDPNPRRSQASSRNSRSDHKNKSRKKTSPPRSPSPHSPQSRHQGHSQASPLNNTPRTVRFKEDTTHQLPSSSTTRYVSELPPLPLMTLTQSSNSSSSRSSKNKPRYRSRH